MRRPVVTKKKQNQRIIGLSKRVMSSFAFDVNHHGVERAKHEDGSYHIVCGFHDESIAEIWERVHRAGDTCNVYIENERGGVFMFRVTQQLPEGTHLATQDEHETWWAAKEAPVALLIDQLRGLRDDEIVYRTDATGHGLGYLSVAYPFLEHPVS